MLRAAMNASFGGLGMRSFMSASAPRSKDMLGALNQLKMGSQRGRAHVMLRASNLRDNLLELLHEEGFVGTYHREGQHFRVNLKYHDNNKPVLSEVQVGLSPPPVSQKYFLLYLSPADGGQGIATLPARHDRPDARSHVGQVVHLPLIQGRSRPRGTHSAPRYFCVHDCVCGRSSARKKASCRQLTRVVCDSAVLSWRASTNLTYGNQHRVNATETANAT
ncbi:MAG: hypothetical protein MHM6MM_000187 [Cercozoa sp. M6MM]